MIEDYSFFQTGTTYHQGDRVLSYTNNYQDVCLWECLSSEYTQATLKPYTYTNLRKKVYFWKQLCCVKSNLELPLPVYYGDCTEGVPKGEGSGPPIEYTLSQITPKPLEDYYENGIFI